MRSMPGRYAPALFLLIALVVPSLAGAQGAQRGFKAGVNLSDLRGSFADIAEPEPKLGFVGGVFVNLPIQRILALQLEVLYSMKGAKFVSEYIDSAGSSLGTFDSRVALRYVEVPVLLQLQLLPAQPVSPYLAFGPTFGITLGGEFQSDVPGFEDSDLDDLKPLDVGFAVGGGLAFDRATFRVMLDARYTTGFTDLYDLEGNLESINSVFSFTLGIAY